jgi:hypothetical protein
MKEAKNNGAFFLTPRGDHKEINKKGKYFSQIK